ncbi:MAG: VWA domain-containing protein [Deltaproteobacteria bacterium]|nr:VWA domain-containing protein [Deltaproteobacteria bacterium]
MRCALAVAIAAGLATAALALPPRAEQPSVARARYAGGQGVAGGTISFLDAGSGPVAVGVGRSFDRRALAASPEITFELGRTRARVAASSRLLAGLEPAPAGGPDDDLIVFALDAPPARVRVLRPGAARPRAKVLVLGIPGLVPGDQDALAGRVREADEGQLEVELEAYYDLRGWAGAPIVLADGGGVLGFVQAVAPDGRTLRVLATPVGVVVDALRFAYEGGRGRPFGSFAAGEAPARPAAAGPLATAPAAAPPAGPPGPVMLAIEHPPDGTVLGGDGALFVAGRAIARRSTGLATDVVFAIDVSSSAGAPSGVDVNGNGIVGAPPDLQGGGLFGRGAVDPGDSVLAAEVAAVRRFVARLDPRHTRVGLVSFAGALGPAGMLARESASSELGLTSSYEDLQRALDRVLARGPRGATHMAAGVDRARIELLGLRGAFSQKGAPGTERIVVFVTDGVPTLPFPGDEPRNVRAVLAAAARARTAGIRVLTYGVGEPALDGPLALVDLARITGGTFTPVRDPARLSDLLADVDLAELAELAVRNATLGVTVPAGDLGADGSFGARVPLRVGRNEIEVTARAADGGRALRRITVHYAPDAPVPALPPGLLARHNHVLELHLAALRRERVASEQERVDVLRKELRLEVERERASALARAERQRKRLEIRIEEPPGAEELRSEREPPAP